MQSSDVLMILNLILLESVLSIDNAAVLATMVKHLPEKQQPRALKYGIWGAFFFRGVCLFIASWLVSVWWLKCLGGLYLCYLAIMNLLPKYIGPEEKKPSALKSFWGTVLMVEFVDIVFSIDNVFAAVALTDKFWVIITGVCIGIITMRFVATKFLVIMKKYPFLETSAYVVIAILGTKLIFEGAIEGCLIAYTCSLKPILVFMHSHIFELVFSGLMVCIFLVPIILHHNKKV